MRWKGPEQRRRSEAVGGSLDRGVEGSHAAPAKHRTWRQPKITRDDSHRLAPAKHHTRRQPSAGTSHPRRRFAANRGRIWHEFRGRQTFERSEGFSVSGASRQSQFTSLRAIEGASFPAGGFAYLKIRATFGLFRRATDTDAAPSPGPRSNVRTIPRNGVAVTASPLGARPAPYPACGPSSSQAPPSPRRAARTGFSTSLSRSNSSLLLWMSNLR